MKTRRFICLSVLVVVLISLIGFISAVQAQPVVIYVDLNATGNNDGSSWANAFTDLEAGLTAAAAGDEVWVAAGTYYPGLSGSPRSVSFHLKSEVAVYGGFAGSETALSERDWIAHPIILSGDVDRNGLLDTANAYHVVSSIGAAQAVLDGLTITGGNGNEIWDQPNDMGGGLYVQNSTISLTNIIFSGNQSRTGGGLFIETPGTAVLMNVSFSNNQATWGSGLWSRDQAVLTKVAFSDNRSTEEGAMVNYGNATLINVTFDGNMSTNVTGIGGGMANFNTASLTNVTFSGNSANSGGGLYNWTDSVTSLTNVTFSGNTAITGGAVYSLTPSSIVLANCILWGNTAATEPQIYGPAAISYSDIQGWTAGGTGNISTDPLFVDAAGGDLHLQLSSPAIDAGDNSVVTAVTDLDGRLRTWGGTVDMGAYERGSLVIYVDADATGANTGASWTDAYTSLQDGINAAFSQDEIWVAEGIYYPTTGGLPSPTLTPTVTLTVTTTLTPTATLTPWQTATLDPGPTLTPSPTLSLTLIPTVIPTPTPAPSQTVSFQLKSGVAIYGGFTGTETQREERNWAANLTILSGDINENGILDTGDTYHVVSAINVDAAAVLDGFSITGGNAGGANPYFLGGGMYSSFSNPVLSNITFAGNFATYGGGLYNADGSPTLNNVTFADNLAESWGGGMYNASGSATLNNVSFIRNSTATGGAGGIYNGNGSPALTNVVFFDNSGGQGGGMANEGGSPSLTNVTFAGNTVAIDGGGIYIISGSATLTNAILWDNRPDQISGAANITYSDVQGGGSDLARHNIDALPQFIDAGNGNLRLLSSSPAINAGDNSALPADTYDLDGDSDITEPVPFDLDGNSRIVHGIVDLGAYEQQTNRPPLAGDDTGTMLKNMPVTIDVLANDSEPDGDPFSVVSVSQPAFGEATFNSNSVTYTPQADFYGSDSFTYTVSDGNGGFGTASVTLQPAIRNDIWTRPYELQPASAGSVQQILELSYQSRWYKFDVLPGSQITVTLTGLPADYDLTLYRDIAAAYRELNTTQDLVQLSAEFSPDMFSPDMFSPDMFSPDMFSPDMFSPDMFSPDMFSPDMFSPDMFSPDMFSPDMFSPDMFSPDMFSPDMFSPDMFSPDMFSPDMFSPDMFSPDMFSPDMFSPDMFSPDPTTFASAQLRSMIAVSGGEGTAAEGIRANSWNQSGEFYIKVTGKHGAFDPHAAFRLEVTVAASACGSIGLSLPPSIPAAADRDNQTIVFTDLERMTFTGTEQAELEAAITAFINRPEVAGVWVDVGLAPASDAGLDPSLAAWLDVANQLADDNPGCPYARNLNAGAIKSIVDSYRAPENSLKYIVLIGNDDVIPFFRYPDDALLANEMDFSPPVLEGTSSQASLKLGYVLGQDEYGSKINLVQGSSIIPIPDLAVGRLVETPSEVMNMLAAYAATQNGVLAPPATGLVMGYDFMADAAAAIGSELQSGLGTTGAVKSLIGGNMVAPLTKCASLGDENCSWTGEQALSALLGRRNDIIFMAAHFSASSMLAADNQSKLVTTDPLISTADLENALIFSAGCHSGYNIVDAHDVPSVTREPDWAQFFASKGATFIGGTGYQYGDTDFLEYSERLYLEFARQLRVGTDAVPLGSALVAAKQAYLANTATMSGIHEKALLEATFFGLPMLSIKMPNPQTAPEPDLSLVTEVKDFTAGPGQVLGSGYADIVDLSPLVTQKEVPLASLEIGADGEPVVYPSVYLSGKDGVVSNPNEPVLPLEMYNVSVADMVLRGVGFRGGSYTDLENILPLTGAAATDIRGVHTPFMTDFFFPVRPWNVNYFDALVDAQAGLTRLAVMPAQYRSSSPTSITGTLRQYDQMAFRLYYSANITSYTDPASGEVYVPAQAAPPVISDISATADGTAINFQATVVGDLTAGIQEVWLVYTILDGVPGGEGKWTPVDLTQGEGDTRVWTGSLFTDVLGGASPSDVRYMVVAVNGVGLVSYATNQGAYYTPGAEPGTLPPVPQEPTEITLQVPELDTFAYGTPVTLTAKVTSGGEPVSGEMVTFRLGAQTRVAVSGADGSAEATFLLLGMPGETTLSANLLGSVNLAPSTATESVTIVKQNTLLTIAAQAPPVLLGKEAAFTATLKDADGVRLSGKTVLFEVREAESENIVYSEAVPSDYTGEARLTFTLQAVGQYTLSAQFVSAGMEDSRYNAASSEINLDVDYDFSGFFNPVENAPFLNVVKAGSAIPIKFSLNGDQGLGILDGAPTVSGITCDMSQPAIEMTETVTANASSLSYAAVEDQYVYVWKTSKPWAGSCRRLVIRLADTAEYTLYFKFK